MELTLERKTSAGWKIVDPGFIFNQGDYTKAAYFLKTDERIRVLLISLEQPGSAAKEGISEAIAYAALESPRLADVIAEMEAKLAEKEGDEFDRALERLDHFKTVQSQLQSTAMH